jgi:hypothetical protein
MLGVPRTSGHGAVKATTIHTHIRNRGPSGVHSLGDGLWEGGSYGGPLKTPYQKGSPGPTVWDYRG